MTPLIQASSNNRQAEKHTPHSHVNKLRFEYDFFYREIPLEAFIGTGHTSACEVLNILLEDRQLRRSLLAERAQAHPHKWRAAHLTHPLLVLPLFLDYYDNDHDFRRKIKNYLGLEVIYKWAL